MENNAKVMMVNEVEKVSEVEMYKHFCSNCGTQYEDSSKNSHICPKCKAEKKKANQKASAESAKRRAKALGLVGTQVYSADRDKLKELAKAKDTTIAEVVKQVLATIEL